MKFLVPAAVVLLLLLLLVGGCVYPGYQRAIVMDEDVHRSWANVETQLQRRYDLIPNIVATVKGVAGQEQKVFGEIAQARQHYGSATTQRDKAEAANEVESALGRLLVIVENYPQLRSSEAFLKLQDQLEGTENRLSVERERYNSEVNALNSFIRVFPGSLYARLAGVERAEYFKNVSAAAEPPKVDFESPKTSFRTRPIIPPARSARFGRAQLVAVAAPPRQRDSEDQSMESESPAVGLVLLFSLAVGIPLWVGAFRWGVSPDARFQMLSTGAILFYFALAMLLGWILAGMVWGGLLWLWAIFAGWGQTAAE